MIGSTSLGAHGKSLSMSRIPPLFFLLGLWPILNVSAAIVSNTTELKEGIFRYHYDNSFLASCDNIVLIGVGTTMKVDGYDFLATEIAHGRAGIIVGIIDHAPGNPFKVSSTKYANLVKAIATNIDNLLPFCKKGNHETNYSGQETAIRQQRQRYIIGGHSASGWAAIMSLSLYDEKVFSPNGFIGLSPFRITDNMPHISIPSLLWGFSTTTCGVTIGNAAEKAYKLSNANKGRVLYQLQNPHGHPSHCIFANHGCPPVCPSLSFDHDYPWIRSAVGDSVGLFLRAMESQDFSRESMELPLPLDVKKQYLKTFVDDDQVFIGQGNVTVAS